MAIAKIKFPIYGIIIVTSILIGIIYIFYELRKSNINKKEILYYFLIYLPFAIAGGKIYTILINGENTSVLTAGLSSYGGLMGVIVGAIIFEKILYCNKNVIKYTVLSLPLVYGISKIACFIAGCCYGIPYNGIFKVIYVDGLNIGQFPIQIVETIISLIIFIICHKNRNKKDIVYNTLITVFITKFLLDFLRYEHIKVLLTRNQIISLILIVLVIIIKKTNFIDKFILHNAKVRNL